ncbi:hypothetical protein ACILDT_11180 [Capnocytophaga canis]|uniref:hypothetical protein n=1 Tax=Capnocytophaga canis TaxID=1848903 RepID=UPI0037D40074
MDTATVTYKRKAYRNEKLSARFYFYNSLVGLRYEVCVRLLEREFDISESRIYELLSQNNNYITFFERNKYSVNDLRKRYPFMVWQYVHGMMSQNAEPLIVCPA